MRPVCILCLIVCASVSLAAEPAWEPVTSTLVQTEKVGYGGLCGVVVDRQTGEVIVNLSDQGFFVSADQGATWSRLGKAPIKGRTESPGCLQIDPTGRSSTMLSAFVYGSPVGVSKDRGESFRFMDAKASHVDWCAVNWNDPEMKFALALKHEMGGLLIASNDGGRTFRDIGKGYISGWVFDDKTAVVAHTGGTDGAEPTLQRTTDGGRTFAAVANYTLVGFHSATALPKWRDGKLYWLTKQGLIVSSDNGATWKQTGTVDRALYGPVFGKDATQMFVLTSAGVVESTNGGGDWSEPIAIPTAMKGGIRGLAWLEYDPKNDVLYLMKMTSDLYRLKRAD